MTRVQPVPRSRHAHSRPRRRIVARAVLTAAAVTAGALVPMAVLAPPAAAATVDPAASYVLQNRGSGKVMDVSGASTADGATVGQYTRGAKAWQQFSFLPSGDGYYRIKARHSGKVVDVEGFSPADGARIAQYPDRNLVNQQVRLEDSAGFVQFKVRNSGKVLEVFENSTADSARLAQYRDLEGRNQQWSLIRVGAATGAGAPPPVTTPPVTTPPPAPAPPTTGCGAAPVNPRATAQARRLLCYIQSQYGNHILSGQQESTWNGGPEYEMNHIQRNTGELPAIRSLDYGDSKDFAGRAVAWWNAGGIPMVGYHMGAPTKPDTYEGTMMSASINATLTAGTPENRSFYQRMDAVAAELQKLENAGVPVIWRPFHEAGGTWFWWSKEGGGQYNRLWRTMFDYYTATKGLDNLIWLNGANGQPQSAFYPGKGYVDIGGADTYAKDYGPQLPMYNATRSVYGTAMPIALHENGPIPDPDQLRSSGARWVMFNTWHGDWLTAQNSVAQLQKAYRSSYVVTRDEVPNLR